MSTRIEIWSDIHCPWSLITTHRLRQARDTLKLDVIFDQRAWPLELVNHSGTPRHIVDPETVVLGEHEPDLFSAFRGHSWPSTLLPAFELVAATRRAQGLQAAENVDYTLRLRFFRDSADISLRHELERACTAAEVNTAAIMAEWDDGSVRADVLADYAHSTQLPIQGSPQIIWPDGSTTHNPGMTDHQWIRGIPHINSTDPRACEYLLQAHLSRV